MKKEDIAFLIVRGLSLYSAIMVAKQLANYAGTIYFLFTPTAGNHTQTLVLIGLHISVLTIIAVVLWVKARPIAKRLIKE